MVAILGILASIAIPSMSKMRTRAQVSGAKANISALANAVAVFKMDKGFYPSSKSYDSREDLFILEQDNSYISQTNYKDPFQRPLQNEQLEMEYSAGINSVPEHGFVYVNYHDFLRPDIPPYDGIGLYSIGPDRRDSWLCLFPLPSGTQKIIRLSMNIVYGSDALRPIVIYNPTNGLISEGDFGAFRGKFNAFIPKDLQ